MRFENPYVLDIGCGPGRDLAELSKLGINALGIDISKSNIENCIRHGTKAVVGDIYMLDEYFDGGVFDDEMLNNWISKFTELVNEYCTVENEEKKYDFLVIINR